ncbi:MAG: DUF3450 domain-containing protein [Nevskia sp.]|nr:DUF3450 domain-containing protein [Nevskia sp.]
MLESTTLKKSLLCAAACSAFLYTGAALAASADPSKIGEAIGVQSKTEQAGKASQSRIDKMDTDVTSLAGEYRAALAETSSVKGYNDQISVQVQSQNEELADLTRQLAQVDTTSREVLPLMTNMLSTLDQFVQLDMPFLPEERAKRIATLKDMMTRADVSLSEKYRRIVEAYQIEMEYGRTLESYQGKVGDKTVDFLRGGRVALLYQTLDGKETGYWDVDAKSWKQDNSYDQDVKAAMKVAKKQAAPDFLTIPIHAPVEAK